VGVPDRCARQRDFTGPDRKRPRRSTDRRTHRETAASTRQQSQLAYSARWIHDICSAPTERARTRSHPRPNPNPSSATGHFLRRWWARGSTTEWVGVLAWTKTSIWPTVGQSIWCCVSLHLDFSSSSDICKHIHRPSYRWCRRHTHRRHRSIACSTPLYHTDDHWVIVRVTVTPCWWWPITHSIMPLTTSPRWPTRHAVCTVKKLSCRTETERYFVPLNISLSHSKSLKIIRNDTMCQGKTVATASNKTVTGKNGEKCIFRPLNRYISETIENRQLQWKTNRKSHTGLRLIPIPMTLNDLKRP